LPVELLLSVELLKKVFPKARIFLCQFHVLKYVKTVISTAHDVDKEDMVEFKHQIMCKFKELVRARKAKNFRTLKKELKELISDKVLFYILELLCCNC
jgi:hypothetical protein